MKEGLVLFSDSHVLVQSIKEMKSRQLNFRKSYKKGAENVSNVF
jgi:hypothetical protein